MTWRSLLLHFSSKFLLIFLILILAVVFFIVSFSRVCYFGFVLSSALGYLTPSCERFLNYFKEGKKHFIV